MASTSKTRSAFTLIELLVALAILSVLISILLPALASARSEGLKTKCLTRLRSLAQLGSAYATDDVRGVYGPVHDKASEYHFEGYADYGGGPGSVQILLGGRSNGNGPPTQVAQPFMWGGDFAPNTRPFNKMIYGVDGMAAPDNSYDDSPLTAGDTSMFEDFRCPGEDFGYQEWPDWEGLPDETEHPYFWADGTSYRLNNLIWREDMGSSTAWVGGVYGRAVTQVPDTSLTIGFMEARAFQTLWTNDRWGFLAHRGELSGYHRKLGCFTVSYVDGHASYVDMGNGTFYPRTLQNNYYDVRGTWGRMDCLPVQMFPDP